MPLVKTHAFVIRTIRYSDSSKILTLFTNELGKISVIHKGSRKNTKSGNSGSFSYYEAMIYFKDNREIQLLSQIHSLRVFKNIVSDIERLRAAYIVQELLNKSMPSNSPDKELFESVFGFFQCIDSVVKNAEFELLKFLVHFAETHGIIPEANSVRFETFFARSGFTLYKSDLDFLNSIRDEIESEEDVIRKDINLNKLCRIYEQLLLDNSVVSGYHRTRSVFDQF